MQIPSEAREEIKAFLAEQPHLKSVDRDTAIITELKSHKGHRFKPAELIHLTERTGFRVCPGGKHQRVLYGKRFVTTIPLHGSSGSITLDVRLSNKIIRRLINCLRTSELTY